MSPVSAPSDGRPAGHPHDRAEPVETTESITPDRFFRDYVRPGRPLVITAMAADWPATRKWSFAFFRDQPETRVSIEHGDILQQSARFGAVDLGTYMDRVMQGDGEEGYLSLFEIFSAFPHLARDVDFSLLAARKRVNQVIGWLGPADTVTGYHVDWADNLFAQIAGRKRFHLVAPDESPCMYPGTKYDWFSKVSEIDPRAWNAGRHPRFAGCHPKVMVLGPGDGCFIPRGWWHYVESLDRSISVNNFGLDLKGLVTDGAREVGKAILHHLGLYRRECTCHMIVDGKRVRKGKR